LLFRWEPPRQRRFAIAGFLLASAGLHAFCFYVFQIVYPPTISLLPPPARVSVIVPTSPEAHAFLNWLEAEDPALASQTQRPVDARAFQLPQLAHIPSYLSVLPQLKDSPKHPAVVLSPSGMPPGPVRTEPPSVPKTTVVSPTMLLFSDELRGLQVTHPELQFQASSRETPQSAQFRVAVDSAGVIRYVFLEQSSGDAALDEQARRCLALCRFRSDKRQANYPALIWASATFEFGTDLQLPPNPTERAP
jgi:hypothetical protein